MPKRVAAKRQRPPAVHKRRKVEKHTKTPDAHADSAETDGLSNTQVSKFVQWALAIDFSKERWWDVRDRLEASLRSSAESEESEAFDSEAKAVAALSARGKRLLQRVHAVMRKEEAKNADFAWARKMAQEGTLKDKFSAIAALAEKCPLIHVGDLRILLASCQKKNRTEVTQAVDVTTDLLTGSSILPEDRQLEVFAPGSKATELLVRKRNDGKYVIPVSELKRDSTHLRLLACLEFEEELRQVVNSLVQAVTVMSRDTVDFVRKKALETAASMVVAKPQEEEAFLFLIVKSLGDTNTKVSSLATSHLARLLTVHPAMKVVVCKKVEELIWMQKVHPDALRLRDNKKVSRLQIRKRRKVKGQSLHDHQKKQVGADEPKEKADSPADKIALSTRRAHAAVHNAALFLSEIKYSPAIDPKNLVSNQLKRYFRILAVMLSDLASSKKQDKSEARSLLKRMKKDERKESRAAKKETPTAETGGDADASKTAAKAEVKVKIEKGADADESAEAPPAKGAVKSSSSGLVTYARGLALTEQGGPTLRLILTGIRRLVPFCSTGKLLKTFGKKSGTAEADKEVEHAGQDVANQLFALVHKVESTVTRVQGWDLLYRLLKETERLSSTFVSNLYAQMREPRYYQCKAREHWCRLILTLVADTESFSVTTRAALMRRLLAVTLHQDSPPSFVLPLLDLIENSLASSPELSAWVKEGEPATDRARKAQPVEATTCIKTTGKKKGKDESVKKETFVATQPICYKMDEFNPEKCGALRSLFWELKFLESSLFPLVASAVPAVYAESQSRPADTEIAEPTNVMMLQDWDTLVELKDDDQPTDRDRKLREIREAMKMSQSLHTLGRLLHGQSIRRALGVKGSNEPQEGEEITEEDHDADLWECSVGDTRVWSSNDQFRFPFKNLLQPFYEERPFAKSPAGGDFEEEVDRVADEWITNLEGGGEGDESGTDFDDSSAEESEEEAEEEEVAPDFAAAEDFNLSDEGDAATASDGDDDDADGLPFDCI